MPDPKPQPVIILKKKVLHQAHHGGAWKVAYADFVTAMMALFIVLWLMNSSKEIQQAVGGYFRDPSGQSQIAAGAGASAGADVEVGKDDMGKLRDAINTELANLTQDQALRDQVQVAVGKEGLRVELLETANGMFFESGNALPSGNGRELLIMLAQQLGKLPNKVLIEGHTDSKPFVRPEYSNWELSTDRANAARRLMEANGLSPNQVIQVRGFADRHLRTPDAPLDPANRRISVVVLNSEEVSAPGAGSTPVQPPPD
jgi:chemotaxis protein MotB